MKYFFILGNNPALSLAEITALVSNYRSLNFCAGSVAILDTDQEIAVDILMKRMGGTIKIGRIFAELAVFDKQSVLREIEREIVSGAGKFHLGFSCYGTEKIDAKVLGMEVKRILKERGVSCRLVVSREKNLSSVVVAQNKLLGNGAEIVIISQQGKLFLGQTMAVQDFKGLSYRDFKRPARDSLSGMLPPKLAQIMINLATRGNSDMVLLDPFCGSGTILMEAILMDFKQVIGSDLSAKAVADTRTNTEWVKNKFNRTDSSFELFQRSATEISRVLSSYQIDAVVTEPYLGPQRGKNFNVQQVKKELSSLYAKAIVEFGKLMKPGAVVVMLWPCFTKNFSKQNKNLIFMDPDFAGFEIENPLPATLRDNRDVKLSPRQTIIYGREGQRVWREVVVLRRLSSAKRSAQNVMKNLYKKKPVR